MKLIIITEEQTQNLRAKGGRRTPPPIPSSSQIPPKIPNPNYEKIVSQISVEDIRKIIEKYGQDITKIKQAIMKIIQQIQKMQ